MRPKLQLRGTALLTVMLAALLLAIMLKALLILAQGRSGATRVYVQHAMARSLLDACVARVQNELALNSSYAPASLSDSLDQMPGTYSVSFSSGPNFDSTQSCNNLAGSTPADGPRGSQSVPPYSVDLCIQVQVEGTTRQAEVLLYRPPQILPDYGLTASGHIQLRGITAIDGTQTLGGTPFKAGIKSELASPGSTAAIAWRPVNPGDHASVSGNVTVVSPSTGAIDFGSDPSAYTVGGFQTGAGADTLPDVAIPDIISAHSSAPAPPLNQVGTTSLNQPEVYYAGDLNLNGDLQLSNTNLYVQGSLSVNGSISGTGAVYVGGSTTFKGNTSVSATSQQGVALYSQGSVQLTGFDGNAYLQSVASSDPQVAALCAQVTQALASFNAASDQSAVIAQVAAQLSGGGALDQLESALVRSPPSGARDFLVAQLSQLSSMWDQVEAALNGGAAPSPGASPLAPGASPLAGSPAPSPVAGDPASQGPGVGSPQNGSGVGSPRTGQFGPPTGGGPPPNIPVLPALTKMSLDLLGTAYFQGIVHTHGFLYASNQVCIVGSAWAYDDGTQAGSTTPTGDPISPGDLYLDNGVTMTVNQQSLDQLGPPLSGQLPPMITAWLEP